LTLVGFDFFHDTVEIRKRTIHYLNVLPNRKENSGFRLDRPLLHLLSNRPNLLIADRRWISAPANETGHLCSFLTDMPGIVIDLHLNQDIAWEELSRRSLLLPLNELDDFFYRYQYLTKAVLLTKRFDSLLQSRLSLLFISRKGVNDVPLFRHTA